jgi:hypothetical protein
MGFVLLMVLIGLILGGLPRWGDSRNWSDGPSDYFGLLPVLLLVLMLVETIPRSF